MRWTHGFDDWEWDEYLGCWWHQGMIVKQWDYYCLGDRMFHRAYGATNKDIVWQGSYEDDWHGGIQTHDFMEALDWLSKANGADHSLW